MAKKAEASRKCLERATRAAERKRKAEERAAAVENRRQAVQDRKNAAREKKAAEAVSGSLTPTKSRLPFGGSAKRVISPMKGISPLKSA